MIIVPPERIAFEHEDDVIDYVTKGFPPSKKNFEKVISKISHPDNIDAYSHKPPRAGIEVVINSYVIPEEDRDVLEYALRRVYKNRIRNRNTALIIGGIAVIGIVGAMIKSNTKSSDSDDEVSNCKHDDNGEYI